MNLFELKPEGGSPIEIFDHVPDDLKPFAHPMFLQAGAREDFGALQFQYYMAEDFAVWYSRYAIDKTITLQARADLPIIECSIPFLNHFLSDLDLIGIVSTRTFHVNFFYVPHVDNTATLFGGKRYETLDFHFRVSALEIYRIYDEVKIFLDKVDANRPAKLEISCSLNRDMRKILKHLIGFEVRPELFRENLRSWITIFLSQVFRELDKPQPQTSFKYITADLLEKAGLAKVIIEREYMLPLTIETLAQRVATNATYLQMAFKRLEGCTLLDYLQRVRITKAEQLLISKDEFLDTIALEVGYADKHSFSKFFSKFHDQSPADFRNQHKKKN
jgi:AraC-like DNA-binding protein